MTYYNVAAQRFQGSNDNEARPSNTYVIVIEHN